MTENELIEIILKQQKSLINSLLKKLKNHDEEITIDDLRNIIWQKLYPYHGNAIIHKLDEINELLKVRHCQCRYSEETEGMMRMMINPNKDGLKKGQSRNTGLKEIRDFTKDGKDLIITDPYIFGGDADDALNYIEEFKRCSRIDNKTITKIHIIYSSKHGNTTSIKNGIKMLANDNHCNLTIYDSDMIHDRIWIKDKSEAIVVGTSFGGIGNRLCFILELPKYDLDNLLDFLIASDYLK